MTTTRILGLCLILLGMVMFFFGVSMFTYQGSNLSPLVSKAGMYSFVLWLPTIITGIILIIIGRRRS